MQKVLVLHDFMLKDRKLKGSRLLVYAFIYSYCQIPNSSFRVHWSNACKFLGISKSAYFDNLKWLIDNNYIYDNYRLYDDSCSHTFEYTSLFKERLKDMSDEEIIKIARTQWVKQF